MDSSMFYLMTFHTILFLIIAFFLFAAFTSNILFLYIRYAHFFTAWEYSSDLQLQRRKNTPAEKRNIILCFASYSIDLPYV